MSMDKGDNKVKWNAAVALASFEVKDAGEYVQSHIEMSDDEWTAWEGLHVLAKANDDRTLEVVYPFVTHPNAKLASEAVMTLSKLTTVPKEQLLKIMAAAKRLKVPEVAARAEFVFLKLKQEL